VQDIDSNTSHTDRTEECTSLMNEVLTVVLIRTCAFSEVAPCQLVSEECSGSKMSNCNSLHGIKSKKT